MRPGPGIWLSLGIILAALAAASAQRVSSPDEATEIKPRWRLLEVRRVFVDRFNGGETAGQIRDMIISSLENTGLFIITENPERADAILRGSAEDLIFTDSFSSSEGLQARVSARLGTDPDTEASDRRSRSAGVSVGEQESVRYAVRRHEATAAVRLVSRDGDVLWSTIQESQGAKFRSASADVADKVARQLLKDWEALRRARNSMEQKKIEH